MTQPDIRRPVVAGAGTMGTTLTRIFAQHGFAVTLWNRRTAPWSGPRPASPEI